MYCDLHCEKLSLFVPLSKVADGTYNVVNCLLKSVGDELSIFLSFFLFFFLIATLGLARDRSEWRNRIHLVDPT